MAKTSIKKNCIFWIKAPVTTIINFSRLFNTSIKKLQCMRLYARNYNSQRSKITALNHIRSFLNQRNFNCGVRRSCWQIDQAGLHSSDYRVS